MFNSDFVWLNFDKEFTRPNEEATRSFYIDEEPTAAHPRGQGITSEGYILIQAEDVGVGASEPGDELTHRVLINGQHLPSFDMVAEDGWNLWMDRVPENFLKKGENTLTIRRRAVDRFRVANVVVQWRERRGTADLSATDRVAVG